jgi:hypothetical protein
MLTVGIERYDEFGAGPERELDAGLQGRALPEVHRVAHYRGARPGGDLAGGISRSVIDQHHPETAATHV